MLLLRKKAEADIQETFAWYENRRESLGHVFVTEVDCALEAIQKYPKMYPKVHKSIRRALCRRFPYAIYFVEKDDVVQVLAVIHQRRHPSSWTE